MIRQISAFINCFLKCFPCLCQALSTIPCADALGWGHLKFASCNPEPHFAQILVIKRKKIEIICIKQGFCIPQGQRTQSLESGRTGLRSEVGTNHRCAAKQISDGPAPTGDTAQTGSTSRHRWGAKGHVTLPSRRHGVTEELPCVSTYGSVSYRRATSSGRTDENFAEEQRQEHLPGMTTTSRCSPGPQSNLLVAITFIWQMHFFGCFNSFGGSWFFGCPAWGINLQKSTGLVWRPRSQPDGH